MGAVFVRGTHGGGALMLSRVSGTLVHMTTLPYISRNLVTALATICHPNLTPIYRIQSGKRGYTQIYSGYVSQLSLRRRFDLIFDSKISAKYHVLPSEPLSSAVLSFIFVDLVELLAYIFSEYRAKKISLSEDTMYTLVNDILSIETIKLDNYGVVRVQLTLREYVTHDTVLNSPSKAVNVQATSNSHRLEVHTFKRLQNLLLALTFVNRDIGPQRGARTSLKAELANLGLCSLYTGSMIDLLETENEKQQTFKKIQDTDVYQSLLATSYIRRGMHVVSQKRYNIYPLHTAVINNDVAQVRLLHRVCAAYRHSTVKTCLMHAFDGLIKYGTDLSFLHNLAVFVPDLYALTLCAFHLYHLQHTVQYTSPRQLEFLNVRNDALISVLCRNCSTCNLLCSATRAHPWQPTAFPEDTEKYTMSSTSTALRKSMDYSFLKMKFPAFHIIASVMEMAMLLLPSECCICSSNVSDAGSGGINEGELYLSYAYQAALECGVLQLNSAVAFYEAIVMEDIFEPHHLTCLNGRQFYLTGRLPITYKIRGASHRPMSRPLMRPLSKHRGIIQQAEEQQSKGQQKNNVTPSELGFAMIHQVPFYPKYVAECAGALDDKGQTALMRAAIIDDLYAIHLLVHVEGQIRVQNSCGLTASMLCAIYDHPRALSIILPFECNMVDLEGWAALTHAVRWMSYDSVMVASPHEAIRFGMQALQALTLDDMGELEDDIDMHAERPMTRSGTVGSMRDRGSAQSLCSLIKFEIQKFMAAVDDNQQLSDSYGPSDDSGGDDPSVDVLE